MPTSQPVLLRAFRWGLIATVVLMALFGVIGWFVSEGRGLTGGLIGAAMGGVFLALTVGSIAFANRFIERDFYIVIFFVLVLGSWIVKLALFIVAAVLLRDQPWLDAHVLFAGFVASVVVSLVLDVVIVSKARIPIASLPE